MSATDNLDEVLKELGDLLRKKNAAYGDSFANVPKILAIMFPLVPEPTLRLILLFARYLDKMARRAATPNAFGEDEVLDFAGYGVLDLCLVRAAAAPVEVVLPEGPVFPAGTSLLHIIEDLGVQCPAQAIDLGEIMVDGKTIHHPGFEPSPGSRSLVVKADPAIGQERREWTIIVEGEHP